MGLETKLTLRMVAASPIRAASRRDLDVAVSLANQSSPDENLPPCNAFPQTAEIKREPNYVVADLHAMLKRGRPVTIFEETHPAGQHFVNIVIIALHRLAYVAKRPYMSAWRGED